MIRISLNELIFVYVLVFLAAILSAWIAYEMARQFREKRLGRSQVRCAVCAMQFEDRTSAILPRCPRCGSLNERDKLKVY